jgi:enoyl-CoA hydratase/carnithine racemase
MLGAARAKEIILTCERYTAEHLFSWGMINRLAAPEQLLETAGEFATRLIAKNPRAVAGSKLSVNAIAAVAAREVSTVQPELFIQAGDG